MLGTEQFPVPVINLCSPNILPCPLSEIREDKDSVKRRAMGDKSSARLVNEIRCLLFVFCQEEGCTFQIPAGFCWF